MINTLVWILQFAIALVFLYSGIHKTIYSREKLVAGGQTGVEDLPVPLIRFIGISEILGAIGLIIPYWLYILPHLTVIAAVSFAAIMVPAAVIHYRRKEWKNVLTNLVLFTICIFIVIERSVK
jgi:uncharacterized membrane protein YphA (DoxX/SURF4 family)